MVVPDRIGSLIQRLEADEPVTQRDVDKIAVLQKLDLAKIGEDFIREWMQRQADYTETMRKSFDDLLKEMA